MPPALVAFLFAAGFGAWVYAKLARNTGGNTQNALIGAGIAGAFTFVAFLIILSIVDKALQ